MKVAIVGCGWLGLPLAKKLVSSGIKVYGTTTKKEKLDKLNKLGVEAYLFRGKVDLEDLQLTHFHPDVAVITIPPSGAIDYPDLILQLIELLPSTCRIVFTSSIGVYEPTIDTVKEDGACLPDHPVLRAEEEIRKQAMGRSVILRLGGLFGAGRHPIAFLAGKKDLSQPKAAVNLVHLQDVIQAIGAIIWKHQSSGTYNLVFPDHPSKEDYYQEKAERMGLEKPVYKTDDTIGKIVVGDKIVKDFDFNYSHDLWTVF